MIDTAQEFQSWPRVTFEQVYTDILPPREYQNELTCLCNPQDYIHLHGHFKEKKKLND